MNMPSASCGCPPPAPAREQRYYDLLSFIVSNAVAGEITAVENYSDMVALLDTDQEKIDTVNQAFEEAKHIRLLQKLGSKVGFTVLDRVVEPQWRAIRGHFRDAVRKGDLTACFLIQDLMTETMAVVLYRALSAE